MRRRGALFQFTSTLMRRLTQRLNKALGILKNLLLPSAKLDHNFASSFIQHSEIFES